MRDIKEIEAGYRRRAESKGKVNLLKKRYILILIILIAFVTNPSKEKHRNVIKGKINVVMGADNPYVGGDSSGHEDVFLNEMIDSYISYSNYLLFSTIGVDYQGETRVIGIGVFGYVYIPDKVEEMLLNYKL